MSDPRAEVKRKMAEEHNRLRDAGTFQTKEDKSESLPTAHEVIEKAQAEELTDKS